MFKNLFDRKLKTDAFTSLIAHSTLINGTLNFSGIIKIQGVVEGDVIRSTTSDTEKCEDCIIVDESGKITSQEMSAQDIIIAGKVFSKKIQAEGTLRVLKNAEINNATIYYRTLEIEPGALLNSCQLKHLDYCSEGEVT